MMNKEEKCQAEGCRTEIACRTERELVRMGAELGRLWEGPGQIHLSGPFGAGKTVFCRGVLHGMGYRGAVKSPTYPLIVSYRFDGQVVFHVDLYRLAKAEELEFIGLRDALAANGMCLIEWPERGAPELGRADLEIELDYLQPLARGGRSLGWTAASKRGQHMARLLIAIARR